MAASELQCSVTTGAVTDHDRRLHADLAAQGRDVIGELLVGDRPHPVALPVPAQIHRDHPMLSDEAVEQRCHVPAITESATVDENDRWIAHTHIVKCNPSAVALD